MQESMLGASPLRTAGMSMPGIPPPPPAGEIIAGHTRTAGEIMPGAHTHTTPDS